MSRSILLGLLVVIGTGATSACVTPPDVTDLLRDPLDTRDCVESVDVDLGGDVVLTNPCSPDGFAVGDDLWLVSELTPWGTLGPVPGMSLDRSATPFHEPVFTLHVEDPIRPGTIIVPARYWRSDLKTAKRVALFIHVKVPDMFISASATPEVIAPLEPVLLTVDVLGGTAPFTIEWDKVLEDGELEVVGSTTSIKEAPIANTTYVVHVTDHNGSSAAATVQVHVRLTASVTAAPGTVAPGQPSHLLAFVEGGASPYTYAWTPAIGLTRTDISNPIATPSATTTFFVTVTDRVGETTSVPVTVSVVRATNASFTLTWVSTSRLQADATASTSTAPIVRYEWTEAVSPLQPAGYYDQCTTSDPTQPNCRVVAEPAIFSWFADPNVTVRLRIVDVAGNIGVATLPVPPQ